ncbi:MAG TPA: hypothetical protein ENO05_12475 [Bacteroides sp.]|nr:hypothetical protein [Bacteroides sp.]
MNNIYRYRIPEAGEIIPEGWIKKQMEKDLTEGYVGHFHRIHPTVTHDVFVKQDRLSKRRFSFEKEWWSGEHEGYWKDSVIRMAFLTGNREYIRKSHRWISEILQHTGEDGYIGIYKEGDEPYTRFRHPGGNGELWATSRILMAMLAYYEFTGNPEVLDAVESAAMLDMDQYRDHNYFAAESRGGGVSHGIGFFEVLEWLYRLTGRDDYLEFAGKLYDDFNRGRVRDDDLKTSRLLDVKRPFRKHGAHIAEGLFVPALIAQMTGLTEYHEAAAKVFRKLNFHTTPGGAMRCDEWIKGRRGTADERYEYCGIAEMISPLGRIISMTGDLELSDRIETMVLNAGQGARLPVLTALSYLTSDNRIRINHREIGGRETYDAIHRAAACCVLNGGRTMPYFVESMWLKDLREDGLTANLFGPCRIHTELSGVRLQVSEETGYPFSDHVRFTFTPAQPVTFPFTIRKPHRCRSVEVSHPPGAVMEDHEDRITLRHTWQKGDHVNVKFHFQVRRMKQPGSATVPGRGLYLKRGPLVYALPFGHRIRKRKEYRGSGFFRYRITATDRKGWKYTIRPDSDFHFMAGEDDHPLSPWENGTVRLAGRLFDHHNQPVPVQLVPMGSTIFRRVTFSVKDHS